MQDTIMRQQNSICNIRPSNQQQLVQKLIDNISTIRYRRSKDTRRLVRQSFETTTDIYLEDIHLSLLCPITKQRIKLPCVSIHCEHLACFDGEAFLRINKGRANWHCPICNVKFDLLDIRIDRLICQVLDLIPKDCIKISFSRTGEWKQVIERENRNRRSGRIMISEEVITLDDIDKDCVKVIGKGESKLDDDNADADDAHTESSDDDESSSDEDVEDPDNGYSEKSEKTIKRSSDFNSVKKDTSTDKSCALKDIVNVNGISVQFKTVYPVRSLMNSKDKVIEVITLDDNTS